MAKLLYYIAEDIQREGMSFVNHLIKRFDSLGEAVSYLTIWRNEWANEGLRTKTFEIDGEVWGVQALDDEFTVVHNYKIFATPIFMAGGVEGL